MKVCRTCGEEKDLSAFHKHKQMSDGRLNICKACTCERVRKHRAENDSVREYDRQRAKLPHRQAQLKKLAEGIKPAHRAVSNAIARGRLIRPDKCSHCQKECKPEAHHDDYDKFLEVRWLCRSCHCKLHAGSLA